MWTVEQLHHMYMYMYMCMHSQSCTMHGSLPGYMYMYMYMIQQLAQVFEVFTRILDLYKLCVECKKQIEMDNSKIPNTISINLSCCCNRVCMITITRLGTLT